MSQTTVIEIGACSSVGMVRRLNEDAFGTPETFQIDDHYQEQYGSLVAVADGMGGHAAGEVASQIAVETLFEVYYSGRDQDPGRALSAGFARANELVHEQALQDATRTNMGTTLVAAAVKGNWVYVANVGDSRAYLIRGIQMEQITDDHSWVAEQVRANVISQDQADSHVFKNIITRAIGSKGDSHPDIFHERLKLHDVLVLCTDGLSNKVHAHEIRAIARGVDDPRDAAQELVNLANQRGGEDNATVIVLRLLAFERTWRGLFSRFSR